MCSAKCGPFFHEIHRREDTGIITLTMIKHCCTSVGLCMEYYKKVHAKRDISFILGNTGKARLLRIIEWILA